MTKFLLAELDDSLSLDCEQNDLAMPYLRVTISKSHSETYQQNPVSVGELFVEKSSQVGRRRSESFRLVPTSTSVKLNTTLCFACMFPHHLGSREDRHVGRWIKRLLFPTIRSRNFSIKQHRDLHPLVIVLVRYNVVKIRSSFKLFKKQKTQHPRPGSEDDEDDPGGA